MLLLRLLLLVAAVSVCMGQCAFNTVSVFLGTSKYTGLTIAGTGVTITENAGMVAGNCVIHLTVGDGDSCKFSDPNYANDVVASCSMGVFTYAPASAVMTPNPCPAANAGTAVAVGTHLYQEKMTYSCAAIADSSCSVFPCEADCTAPGVVTPAVNCEANCPLGVQTGLIITTTINGAGGEDCTGTTIGVGPYSPTCGVAVATGYTCAPAIPTTVSCPATTMTNLITTTCSENLCTLLAAIPTAGVIGDPSGSDQCPSTNIQLSVISDPSCDIMCDQAAGYQAQTGTYQCGSPADMSAGQAIVSSITACVAVPCPVNSSPVSLGVCTCDTGYTGVITYTGVAYSGSCTIIDCDPYVLPSDFVAGDTDGCVGGDILNVNDVTCNVKCAPGYIASTGTVTCDYLVTQKSTTPLVCTEKTCTPYTFGTGITSGLSNGCVAPQTLRQVTQASCTLSCLPGYTGADGTLDCPNSLASGSAPIVNIACAENTCAAYVLQTGETAVAPGCGSLGTATGNTCVITCDTGYTVGTGTVTCPSNAVNGQVPTVTVDPDCRATCALHSCGVGYTPKSVLSTICNTMTGCDDVTCCDPAPCPTNSVTTHTDPMTSTCDCLNGFTGSATWDGSGLVWSHTCTAHCANTNYGGCNPSTMTAKPSPATILCTGSGGCDAMGCAACLDTDCCDYTLCVAPGSNFPEYTFGGAMGTSCTSVGDCLPVGCATGYVGTPVLQCTSPGGMFSFSSTCTAAPCPANAGPPGVCDCNGGYRVVGGGLPTFNSMTGSWTHTCEATCSLYTNCPKPGYDLIPSPETVACPGSSGNPAVDCNIATCCVETCDNSLFSCPASGYSMRANPSTIKCPASGCDQATCCLAMCDNSGFTGCSAAGFIDKPNQNSIACGDNTIASCTTSLCCLATTCSNVPCPSGTFSTSPVPSCSVCTESICCTENSCQPLTPGQLPEYMVAGGGACTTVSGCNPTGCAAGYHPDPVAQLVCATHGGLFTANGCSENVCTSGTVANYVTSTSPCNSKTACGSVSCAVGYNDGGNPSNPAVDCPTDGGVLVGSGCQENVCTAPGSDGIQGVTFTGLPSCTTVTACGSIACARGYTPTGTPAISCLNPGGAFTQTGCLSKTCRSPLTNPVDGYSVTIPTCTRTEQCGAVVCNIGYYAVGTPSIVCPVANGDFEYSGCDVVPCPSNASGSQCVCDNGFDGTPNWDAMSNNWTHTCTPTTCPLNAAPPGNCTCNVGYSGTPSWSGTAWTHVCTLVPCPANASGTLCQCDAGFSGNPSWSVALQSWTHTCNVGTTCGSNEYYNTTTTSCQCITGYRRSGSVCVAAPCPSGATPPGVCVCQSGGGAPNWDDVLDVWVHTCSSGGCGVNAFFDTSTGFCECSDGYTGKVKGVGTCTVVACPAGASPPGICNCPTSVTRVWDRPTGRWLHTCTTCSANAYYDTTRGYCRCHNGYTGMVNGIGSCNAVACPAGASPPGVCSCPGGSPVAQWSEASQSWIHVCGGNIAPTVTVTSPLVTVPFGTAVVSQSSFLIGITGPESWQTVTIACTAADQSLFVVQPNFQIVGTTGTLKFTRLGNSVGQTRVTCQATDNGSPVLSTAFNFDINLLGGSVQRCGYPSATCVLLQPQVTVSVDSQGNIPGYVTNLDPTSQTICQEQGATLLRQQPVIAADGTLSFSSLSTQGTTTVTCTSTAAGQVTGSVYTFTISVIGISNRWLRARVSTTLSAFSEDGFIKATIDILNRAATIRVQGISVKYACPMSACPGAAGDTLDRLQCPSTHSGRLAQSCRAVFLEARGPQALQSTSDVIVDFDIITEQVDGSAAKMSERETTAVTLNNAIQQCVSIGAQCDYTQNAVPITPGTNVVFASSIDHSTFGPPPATATPFPDTDSDDTPWWIWILIGLGVLLCCCLFILAYVFMKRKDKKKKKQLEQESGPRRIVFAKQAGEGSYTYGSSYGSSYPSESYSSGAEVFAPGEKVRAQYIDGADYDGEIFGQAADGTYNIRWFDGSHSEGVPSRQITRIE